MSRRLPQAWAPPPNSRRILGSLVACLLLAAPCAQLVGERSASAQGDSVTEVARQRFQDGVAAYQAGKFEEARAAFYQAYALKRVPVVLLNLAQSELRTQPPHLEEAGQHFSQYLREDVNSAPDKRAEGEKGLAEVKKRTGSLNVAVDVSGAEIAVDGAVVGKSPLPDPVFIKPGTHVVTAASGGRTVAASAEAKLGTTSSVVLTLGGGAAPIPAPVPVPAPVPAGPAAGPPPLPPALPPPNAGPNPPGQAPPEQPTELTLFAWYKQKPVAWVTTGVAGIGLVGGIAMGAVAMSSASQANQQTFILKNKPPLNGQPPCGPIGGGGDQPGYEQACTTLRNDINAYNTDLAIAITGWVLFGVGAGATVTYAMVDWYPKRHGAPTTGFRIETVTPVAGPTFKGLAVVGSF